LTVPPSYHPEFLKFFHFSELFVAPPLVKISKAESNIKVNAIFASYRFKLGSLALKEDRRLKAIEKQVLNKMKNAVFWDVAP
jgi:hypothetical protein